MIMEVVKLLSSLTPKLCKILLREKGITNDKKNAGSIKIPHSRNEKS